MAKSNADSKLRNLDAIKQMLQGNHKFQTKTTVSFSDIKPAESKREVGEVWTDSEGNEWEQRKGYKIRKGVFDELRAELNSFPKCKKETCTCIKPNRLDLKMRIIHGMCFDCVVEMEHDLRLEGKYEDYEKNKMKQNAMAWLRDSEQEVEALKIAVTKAPEMVNVDGSTSKWELGYDPKQMTDSIDEQYDSIRKKIFDNYNISEEEFQNFKMQK